MSDTPHEQTAPPTSEPAPADDLRDKFRAALDRKHDKDAGGAGDGTAAAGAGGKASARTSNSKRQREFRRKSGG